MKHILLSIIGVGLLSVSVSSAGFMLYPYQSTTSQKSVCASTDEVCKSQQTPEQNNKSHEELVAEAAKKRKAWNAKIKAEKDKQLEIRLLNFCRTIHPDTNLQTCMKEFRKFFILDSQRRL